MTDRTYVVGSIQNRDTGKIVLFVLIAVFLVFLLSLFFRKYVSQGYQYETVQSKLAYFNAEKENTIDVVFVGDSTAWAAYSPEYLYRISGITSYNCATTGQVIGDSNTIVENALKKQSPILIVVDANALYTRLSRAKYLLSRYFPVFHYHFAHPVNEPSGRDIIRGYNSYDPASAYTGSTEYMYEMPVFPFSALATEKINDLYELCNRNDTRMIVVSTPNPRDWNMGKHKAVQEWCDSHGVEFIDYNLLTEEIGIDWNADTRDGGEHLNNSGAYKVCKHLSDYLKEHFELPDHRDDPAYKEWNEDYGGEGV